MALTTELLTPDRWDAFADLFGRQGACYGCWCMHLRQPPKARRDSSNLRNRDLIKARIEAGPPPGLLAFDAGTAVGWMQIGPRFDVPEWNNKGRASAPLRPEDASDPAAWAISCFYVRTGARGSGVTHRLVAAGIDHARASGARMVEACPMVQARTSASLGLYVGSASVFEKAGFRPVAERKKGRPLMRLVLV